MNPELLLRFGSRIKTLRVAAGLTGSELADKISGKLSKSYVSDIERGRRQPREEVTREIARVLGTDPSELVLLSGRMPSDMGADQVIALGEKNVQRVRSNGAGKGKRQTHRVAGRGARKKGR